jgi:[NiFe] hydrogenase assembly HybE family chaperone
MSTTTPIQDNPAAGFAVHYQAQWAQGGQDMAEINPALAVEVIGFTRYEGDWLGVVITPWFLRLYLAPGGGNLWGDIPAGQRRYLALAGETLVFTAECDAELGAFQYTTLIEPLDLIADMAAARLMAGRVMSGFGYRVADEPTPAVIPETPPPAAGVSRRGFFRRLAGKR